MKKSFYIVDDHEMLRLGIISYIENNSGWICIGSTGDHNQVMQELEKLSAEGRLPSVLISDLNFYGEDIGFSLVKNIHEKYPEIRIIVYSMYFAPGVVQNAVQNGAHGYISKNASSAELLSCMDKVVEGELFIQDELQKKLYKYTAITDALTNREKAVLDLLVRHYTNDQISEELGIKRRAVENYISSIYEKTGINDRAELLQKYGK